ncbi:glycosyltransferase [Streptomyces sp. AV19]|uniref:glycosyltransferase n=1 Tax=Streptomyces sp. AV19 TaxID=2793068 RepID=UPI0018FEB4C2|nr:glycosyltransferase [Streptomyces sp. AV19]MBH1935912.1 glycosyltransferase [Streptomyces sp. AV19]MDG4534305.1 glycosyltransferase [Streptomyces sp. AV19]
MKIEFLLHNAYGIGGTIRSTLNLATALADRHEVRIISVNRPVDEPELTIDPRVRLTPLVDLREGTETDEYAAPLNRKPSEIFRDERIDNGRMAATALTDERVRAHLAATDADVVIATRPKLIGYLAEYGDDRYLRIGQEHLTHEAHVPELHAVMDRAINALDAFATVSEADAGHYRDRLPGGGRAKVLAVPNAVPAPAAEPSDGTSKIIVSAGRLVSVKRYDRLIEAFARIAGERPDWQLRIYGRGTSKAKLRARIEKLGLYERVTLMGARSPIETEWSKGAVAAVASDAESFGMTIVEAMHAGLPVIATDCPYGPREILSDGTDGVLVPLSSSDEAANVEAYAEALLKLTGDAGQRARLGAAARGAAKRYEPDAIARRYERLFEELRPGCTAAAKKGLLRGLFGGGRAKQPAPEPQVTPEVANPAARCAVASDGSLVLRVRADELTAADTHLLLRHRGSKGKESVRVPLTARGGWAEARVDRSAHAALPEGRWDTYAERPGDKSRRRLRAVLVEQKALLRLELSSSVWIPYETSDGFLAVRTWLRPEHAEAVAVRVEEEAVTVTVRASGVKLGEGAELVARLRGGEGAVGDVRAPLSAEDGVARLPYGVMWERRGEEQDLWDLSVRPAAGAPLVRVGRLAGDFADRKGVDTFPGVERGGVRVRPFFTVTNDLTLSVKDVVVEEGE